MTHPGRRRMTLPRIGQDLTGAGPRGVSHSAAGNGEVTETRYGWLAGWRRRPARLLHISQPGGKAGGRYGGAHSRLAFRGLFVAKWSTVRSRSELDLMFD